VRTPWGVWQLRRSYGEVYNAVDKRTNAVVAIKARGCIAAQGL
jgi:hypothetical protein